MDQTVAQVLNVQNATVLIVDDHADVREGIRDLLRLGYPGLTIETVADAECALGLAGRQQFDVVLMDITLPGMGGIDAIRVMRPLQPSAQFLVISVHEGQAYREGAKAVGADGFVGKRHLHDELLSTLGVLLRRCKTSDGQRAMCAGP
jgi:DNA-binding NarL/FixJ family response regulator